MIIENLDQVTQAVLEEMHRTPDARSKEILESLVRHLHAFVRETRLTEKEFDQAINYIAALGQLTTESHNEVRLMAGSLGVSTLVCLLNNGPDAATESSANLTHPRPRYVTRCLSRYPEYTNAVFRKKAAILLRTFESIQEFDAFSSRLDCCVDETLDQVCQPAGVYRETGQAHPPQRVGAWVEPEQEYVVLGDARVGRTEPCPNVPVNASRWNCRERLETHRT